MCQGTGVRVPIMTWAKKLLYLLFAQQVSRTNYLKSQLYCKLRCAPYNTLSLMVCTLAVHWGSTSHTNVLPSHFPHSVLKLHLNSQPQSGIITKPPLLYPPSTACCHAHNKRIWFEHVGTYLVRPEKYDDFSCTTIQTGVPANNKYTVRLLEYEFQ
jgi:hypothetical protein